jgi:4-alpha-glucanotransferase
VSERPRLRALARALGVVDAYLEAGSGERRTTSDAAREGLMAAMGLDASSEAAAARALDRLRAEARDALLPAVEVVREGGASARRLACALRGARGRRAEWCVAVRAESGAQSVREGSGRVGSRGLALPLPGLPAGYHDVEVEVAVAGGARRASQRRVIAPDACTPLAARTGERAGFGLTANLYAVRSRGGSGAGDLRDLRRLVAWADAEGASFVGTNPLHAVAHGSSDPSPYSPVSRLYRSVLYLEVEAVPEWREAGGPRARAAEPEALRARAALRDAARVPYAEVVSRKLALLRELHATFAARERARPGARGRAFQAYREREGRVLEDFATFLAIGALVRGGGPGAFDFRAWPAELRDPRSPAVAAFRARHRVEIGFHAWVQFELDRQLAAVGRRAAALPLGLYGDLALGVDPGGSDVWTDRGLFADARAGAPPDEFNPAGQDWGFQPSDPRPLRARAFEPWIRVLRAAFAHCGALRLDHVLGLHRLWWIPRGAPPRDGAYVLQPEAELLGILALESRRHGAVVVGEDLGTVPHGLGARLARAGVLSMRVLLFERDGESFRASRRWSRRAVASVNTHDLPPLAGWASGRDLALRRRIGQIASDEELAAQRARRDADVRALRRRLVREGLLPAGGPVPSTSRLLAAVTAFLGRTPAPLVGLALDDLAGEEEPVNLPGVPPERWPSWTRRMGVALEDLPRHPLARAALDAMPAARVRQRVRRPPRGAAARRR